MKQLGISIIGTDTDVGKTFVTGLLGAMAVDDGFCRWYGETRIF